MRPMSRCPELARALLPAALFLLVGCGEDENGELEQSSPPNCNPISADNCLLPWPSSFYLKTDSSTATGYRINYAVDKSSCTKSTEQAPAILTCVMPANEEGLVLDPSRYNLADGFSVGSQIVVYFKSGISSAGLPGQKELAASVTDKSLIWVMNMATAARVPLFAELDANTETDSEPRNPGLIIRPQVPLLHNTRYVVLLREGLKDGRGNPLSPPEPFRRIRDGEAIGDVTLRAEADRLKDVLSFLDKQQVPRAKVILAWDFHTASEKSVQSNLLTMVEGALAKLPAGGPSFSSVTYEDKDKTKEPYLLRAIIGQMHVPSYLKSDASGSWLNLDAAGKPTYRGLQKFPFYIHIPRCAESASGPLPVLIFGHGLFGTLKGEMLTDYHKQLADRLCMVEAVISWIGLAEEDVAGILTDVITKDFSNLPRITDRLQQAQVNVHTLVRLMKGDFLKEKAMQVGGKAVTDGKTLYYLGISNGGIQGVPFSALSKEIERFVFNVSAGWWSLMIQRSSNFIALDLALKMRFPHSVDRLALFSLSQHMWDHTDPINFAHNVIASPLSGRTAKKIIMQEAKDDDQVNNLATRAVARGIGLFALSPVVESVYGLTEKKGPLGSAYAQWNTSPKIKPPGTNVPAPKPSDDESAHQAVRRLESCVKQLEAFFKPDGQVVHTCSGPCDPE